MPIHSTPQQGVSHDSKRGRGSLRFPRALLGALSPRTLLIALAAALGLLLGSSPAWAAAGRLSVANDRSEAVLLQVDRDNLGQIGAYGRTSLAMHPGRHEVVIRSRAGQTLLRTVEIVRPGSTTSVRLAAIDAPVRVQNPLDRPVRVVVDGRDRGSLAAFASRSLTLELGRHTMALVLDGRAIVSEGLAISARAGQSWAPKPAMIGDLVVNNPLPMPVTLTCSRGLSRTLPAHGSTTYGGLGEGTFALTVRRADGGEIIDQLRPRVRAFDTVVTTIDQPQLGIMAVHSERRKSMVRVYIDGRYQVELAPGASTRLQLSPGLHEVVIRHSEGQVLDREMVRVDRYDVARFEVERSEHHQRPGDLYSYRDDDRIYGGAGRDHTSRSTYSRSTSSCSMP